jgi:putative redox protein
MSTAKILGSATAENSGDVYRTKINSGNDVFVADEPIEFGGSGAGPSPIDYLCMALASCKAITMRMYANRKKWNLEKVNVKVNFVKGDQLSSGLNTFYCSVSLTGALTDEQSKRILEISRVCPVDRLLIKPSEIVTILE